MVNQISDRATWTPKNYFVDGAEKYTLTSKTVFGTFGTMVTAKIANPPPIYPGRQFLTFAGTRTSRVNFPQNKMKEFSVSGSNPVVESKAGGGENEAKMPVVQVENELPSTWGRRTRLPVLRARVAADDNRDNGSNNVEFLRSQAPQTPNGATWGVFGDFSHYFPPLLPHTRPLKTLINVIGSANEFWGELRTAFKSFFTRLLPACHTHTLFPIRGPQNA